MDHVRSKTFGDYKAGGTPWTVIIDASGTVRANDFHIEPGEAADLIERLRGEAKAPAGK